MKWEAVGYNFSFEPRNEYSWRMMEMMRLMDFSRKHQKREGKTSSFCHFVGLLVYFGGFSLFISIFAYEVSFLKLQQYARLFHRFFSPTLRKERENLSGGKHLENTENTAYQS